MKSSYKEFGIECGAGWKKLYEPLIELCRQEGIEILQIKEKFGGLRFYVGAYPDHIRDAIDKAENLSYKTCENCGEPGKIRSGSWISTLCDKCVKE